MRRNFVPTARLITIHQLLTHTAGLIENCGRDFDRLTRSELISRCLTKVKVPVQVLHSNLTGLRWLWSCRFSDRFRLGYRHSIPCSCGIGDIGPSG